MPAGVKPPQCVGKKGRSGRKSCADEALKNRVKHKAWSKTEVEMDKNIAAQIVLKDMTVKSDIMSGGKRIANIDLFDYVKWLENNNSDQQDKGDGEEGEDLPGGDISEQNL